MSLSLQECVFTQTDRCYATVQDQYEMIYDIVSAKLRCGTTSVNVADLATSIRLLATPSGRRARLCGFDKQYTVSNERGRFIGLLGNARGAEMITSTHLYTAESLKCMVVRPSTRLF